MCTYPIRTSTISRNTITNNGGAGVLLALSTNDGLPVGRRPITRHAEPDQRNAKSYGPFLRGGICIQGGQANGHGQLTVTANQIVDNGGYGLCKHPFDGYTMQLTVSGQRLRPERARRQRVVSADGDLGRLGLESPSPDTLPRSEIRRPKGVKSMRKFIVAAAAAATLAFAGTAAAALVPGVFDPGNTGLSGRHVHERRPAPREELPHADERGGRC